MIVMVSAAFGKILADHGYIEGRDFKVYPSLPVISQSSIGMSALIHGFEVKVVIHDKNHSADRPDA